MSPCGLRVSACETTGSESWKRTSLSIPKQRKSKFEGFGLPILEAFRAGLPIISSNASKLPEVARNGALYFDPD
jgi:glycosyltransferase involved in cell wall biosynthesis